MRANRFSNERASCHTSRRDNLYLPGGLFVEVKRSIPIWAMLLCAMFVSHAVADDILAESGSKSEIANIPAADTLHWYNRWIATGCWFNRTDLTLRGSSSSESNGSIFRRKTIARNLLGAWGRYYVSQDFEARFEVSGFSAKGAGGSLSFSDGISGAALVRYQPPGAAWLVQAGLASPHDGTLNKSQLPLARLLSDPLLGITESSLASGWSFHLGGVGGYPISPNLELYGGAGYELATSYTPTLQATIDPGNRASLLGGLNMHGLLLPSMKAGLELGLLFDGEQKVAKQVIRGADQSTRLSVYCGGTTGPFELLLQAALVSNGKLEWVSSEEAGTYLEAGPGRLTSLGLEIAPLRFFQLGQSLTIQPRLALSLRKYKPNDLPYGDGQMMLLIPKLLIDGFGPLVTVDLAWQSGTWADPADAELEGDISGMRTRIFLSWPGASHLGESERSLKE